MMLSCQWYLESGPRGCLVIVTTSLVGHIASASVRSLGPFPVCISFPESLFQRREGSGHGDDMLWSRAVKRVISQVFVKKTSLLVVGASLYSSVQTSDATGP